MARDDKTIKSHVKPQDLNPGAGSPVELVRKAAQKIREWEKRRETFHFKSILLDRGTEAMNNEAEALASAEGIDLLIWQDPDHEAFLLRHFAGCQTLRPPAGSSMRALKRLWPDYDKATPAIKLAQKIKFADIIAASGVEPGLRTLLNKIGFISS